jgi:hypothetical protein
MYVVVGNGPLISDQCHCQFYVCVFAFVCAREIICLLRVFESTPLTCSELELWQKSYFYLGFSL